MHMYASLNTQAPLIKSDIKLTSYKLCVKGTSHLKCTGRVVEFYIIDTYLTPILAAQASQELGIVKIILNTNNQPKCVIEQYSTLFQELGCLKVPYKIKLDSTITLIVVLCRNQPAPLRERLSGMISWTFVALHRPPLPEDLCTFLTVYAHDNL